MTISRTILRRAILLSACLIFAACTARDYDPLTPGALTTGTPQHVLVATTRAEDPDGYWGSERSETLSFLDITVSIPPDRLPGGLDLPRPPPDPETEFLTANRTVLPSAQAFRTALRRQLSALPRDQRAVMLYIHGYNDTQHGAAFRAAQLTRDLNIPGVPVVYSWPSRGQATGYVYDQDSMLFARDGLAEMLGIITAETGRPVLLFAHSLGSALAMEVMRQGDIASPGWSAKTLAGVVLISPDLDVSVFRTQMRRLQPVPEPFVIFASTRDPVLGLSGLIRGERQPDRLGAVPGLGKLADFPVVVINTSDFKDPRGVAHFLPASSPSLVALLAQIDWIDSVFAPAQRRGRQTPSVPVVQEGQAREVRIVNTDDIR